MKVVKRYRNNYTVISNDLIKDKTLSWKARGIFLYLWSMPDDWEFYETELSKHATDGRSSLRSGLQELEEKGYMQRKRTRNKKGQVSGSYWELFDKPMFDFPTQDKPTQDKPTQDNHTLLSTNKQSTNKLNTNNKKREQKKKSPPKIKKRGYGEFENVMLTDKEMKKLKERFPDSYQERIERLSDYVASKGAKYKSHYATIISWYNRDKKKADEAQNKPRHQNDLSDEELEDLPF